MNGTDSALYAIIYFLASLAILGNSIVVFYFFTYIKTISSVTSQLILLIHISAVFESIASLPYVFLGSPGVCQAMGAFHYYFGLIIFGSDVCLTILVTNYMNKNDPRVEDNIMRYGIPCILLFSFITFLPFSTSSYGVNNEVWCSINYYQEVNNVWSFFVFYIWAFLAWLVSFGFLSYLHYAVHNSPLAAAAYRSVASYVIATLFSIGPRLFPRFINLFTDINISFAAQFVIQGGIYVSTTLYCLCFYCNKDMIAEYERRTVVSSTNAPKISLKEFNNIFDWSFASAVRSWSTASAHNTELTALGRNSGGASDGIHSSSYQTSLGASDHIAALGRLARANTDASLGGISQQAPDKISNPIHDNPDINKSFNADV